MIPVSSAISGAMVWSKTPHQRGYELKCNGEIIGSLKAISFWSSDVQAESRHGSWRFRRTGCLRTGTEIINLNSETRIATLKPDWHGGGTLVFSDGPTFQITSKGFWRPVWTVIGDSGEVVLRIHSREKRVELPKELPLAEERLILLVIFARHLMQRAAEDAASVAGLAVATS